ncbi:MULTISPECIES: class A beta-lactamase [unclassified Rathayibacter]|uniref:class A beta-lactamase n=1 Tax=unclassified Rathayibacter TaxID=2609250 RepID=UPI0006FDD20F|nr:MULTISPECIES: class A beta-lactamase [unclassified Rathayibacter]KQQ03589.1 class A beta-lactamase [Rathayibacter sp. Leaf294]KQS12045.1 class A beta-lactamase [Rathayibacter sp. Leaf185]
MRGRPPGAAARPLLLVAAVLVLAGCTSPGAPAASSPPSTAAAPPASSAPIDVSAELAALESEFDARIGVSAVDTASDRLVSHRQDERFGYASSIKVLAAAQFLRAVPAAERDEIVTWTAADVEAAGYSPVTSESIGEGLPLSELAEAAVRRSDNTALNLVLARLGGPSALDRGLEDLGDTTTEVVDDEPALNTIEPGSTANTTTPAAFTAALRAVTLGTALPGEDRALLLDWMSGNATGDALVRAGAPSGWVVADKSGGAGGIRNDVAVVTPPGRDPIVLSILTARNDPDAAYDDALVARSAAVVLGALD